MPERIHHHFLRDMLEATRAALEFTADIDFDGFAASREKQFAVVRALEVLGEAANHVPEVVRKKHAALPWREMIAMRNKVVHEYFGINLEIVWRTVRDELPELEAAIAAVVEAEFRLTPP